MLLRELRELRQNLATLENKDYRLALEDRRLASLSLQYIYRVRSWLRNSQFFPITGIIVLVKDGSPSLILLARYWIDFDAWSIRTLTVGAYPSTFITLAILMSAQEQFQKRKRTFGRGRVEMDNWPSLSSMHSLP